jgi:hypothetical protein
MISILLRMISILLRPLEIIATSVATSVLTALIFGAAILRNAVDRSGE